MTALHEEIERRLRRIFQVLKDGDDVAPALRLRTEGLLEAAVLIGAAREAELCATVTEIWTEVYGSPPEESLGGAWREFYPFPQIPAIARRAPVYPGTSN